LFGGEGAETLAFGCTTGQPRSRSADHEQDPVPDATTTATQSVEKRRAVANTGKLHRTERSRAKQEKRRGKVLEM
jgi:hypothetical protein